ncbi:MAG TPA: hypothetical protein VN018_07185 [Brevundimonas sp.]|nr:hypothetical protein [Brevundimonas sp.]
MKQRTLREVICWTILILHFVAIGFAFTLFDAGQALDIALLMAPLTGAFLTIILQHYFGGKDDEADQRRYSGTITRLSIVLTAAFGIMILAVLLMYKFNKIDDVPMLTKYVGFIETGLGFYVAMIIRYMFGAADGAQPPVPAPLSTT